MAYDKDSSSLRQASIGSAAMSRSTMKRSIEVDEGFQQTMDDFSRRIFDPDERAKRAEADAISGLDAKESRRRLPDISSIADLQADNQYEG